MPRSNRNPNSDIPKRLQTELQSLVAFACYDSNQVLKRGTSAKRETIIQKIASLYFPSNSAGDQLSFVELMLEGKGRFRYLFNDSVSKEVSSTVSRDKISEESNTTDLIIPSSLHCIDGKEIKVQKGCIDKSLLTRKNLGNLVDIKALTLYRHAKDVEANCKKALSFCLQPDSPYYNFNGTFPSGTNWEDYLVWIKQKMYEFESKAHIEDLLDEDSTSNEADGRDEDEDGSNNCTEIIENSSNAVNSANATTETSTVNAKEIPPGEYFKGFIAFALWGYIPPSGGEQYKSTLIGTIVEKETKGKKDNSRAAVMKELKEEKFYLKELEKRGTNSYKAEEESRFDALKDIMVKGREEMSKQRLYKCRINKIEFQLRFAAARIKEIKEELQEIKDDSDSDDDKKSKIHDLKQELKMTRESKKDSYQNWKVVTEAEEARRVLLNTEVDIPKDADSISTATSASSKRKLDGDISSEIIVKNNKKTCDNL